MAGKTPEKQQAIQLVGPDQLKRNTDKPVYEPGPHQILAKVEAIGLCFSDLKLLKQFSGHVRKGDVIGGVDSQVLENLPSYVPGDQPTVPGHEVTVRIVATGPDVERKVGERALVQTDYRWLPTAAGSNAAFGYNFEGALQEYVLMDERVITSPEGESMLIPVSDEYSSSGVALAEPWACVENAYVSPERTHALDGGSLLVVVDEGRREKGVAGTYPPDEGPGKVTVAAKEAKNRTVEGLRFDGSPKTCAALDELGDEQFDDIVYFGSNPETIERLDKALALRGLLNIVLGGEKINKPVSLGFGRCHYGGMRYTGTAGDDATEGLKRIPETPEIRPDDEIMVSGAAGPMGIMHVIRALCQGVEGVSVVATDLDDKRLAKLDSIASKLAEDRGLSYRSLNPKKDSTPIESTYAVIMVPVPQLVAQAVQDSKPNGIINIFAGIPATVFHEIDLDSYIEKGLYFIGTSGSLVRDMKIVLEKLFSGQLDAKLSVGAVSGMKGAIDGIRAVENRSIAGKIIVYPMLHDLELTPLEDLDKVAPEAAAKLQDGLWTKEAERALTEGVKD